MTLIPRSSSFGASSADTSFGVARNTTSAFDDFSASTEKDSEEYSATTSACGCRSRIFESSTPA